MHRASLQSILGVSLATAALAIAEPYGAHAAAMVDSVSVFTNGAAVGATQPDSVTAGNGSVWIEYGNGADSTGMGGSSTIVQYSAATGAIQNTYTIAGSVDGLKIDPTTGLVWALQNQDGNSTLSLINPVTHTVSGPLTYASPPYVYGPSSGRGYDDVAFLGNQVFLSYTNPSSPTDPVIQSLDQGHTPTTPLTTTNILTNQQTGTNCDSDSLKATPSGRVVLTCEGDGLGSGSNGVIVLVSNPGTANQMVDDVYVTDGMGNNVEGMDDVLFPSTSSGTLYVTDTDTDLVYAVKLSGLDPSVPIASLASFDELGLVDLATGAAAPLLTAADIPDGSFDSPHGLDFIPSAVPEPGALAVLCVGLFGLPLARRSRV